MIKNALQQVRTTIELACQSAGRPADSVSLLAVSKRHHADKIREAFFDGQGDFGENYLNEALTKQTALSDLSINWHFIGHIQSNKTKRIAENFNWAHAVDSLKVAKRLSKQRPESLPPINICLQINIDEEHTKAGLLPHQEPLLALAKDISLLPNVNLRGLMCIPALKKTKEEERETFTRMSDLQRYLNHNGLSLDTLSMGMSDDLDTAIECGATIVRVGTAIFGARD